MFDQATRTYWLKQQLKKQLIEFCNHQKVVMHIAEMADCLQEVAQDIQRKGIDISNL
jgi:hypothetical protein